MRKQTVSKDLGVLLRRSHRGVVHRAAELNQALMNLRYEGKPMFGKNLRRIQTLFGALAQELSKDMAFEEQELFPFLETHVPKLKFMINILEEEHHDLRQNLERFHSLLQGLSKKARDDSQMGLIEKMRKKGSYLSYFLYNHTLAENESVYRVMAAELNRDEKNELVRKFTGGTYENCPASIGNRIRSHRLEKVWAISRD